MPARRHLQALSRHVVAYNKDTEPSQSRRALPSVEHFVSCHPDTAAMPHIAPVILKRRPGFLGTPKRPPPWALGTGIGRAPLRCLLVVSSASPSSLGLLILLLSWM